MPNPSRFGLAALLTALFVLPLGAADPAKPGATATTVAGLAELLKSTGLTQPQLLNGVKTGLGTAVDLAATELAKPDAFHLSGPTSMAKLQAALVRVNESGALDSFKASLNQAASSVAPQTTALLKESLKTLSLNDAGTLATGTSDAATRMLRKSAEPLLRTKLVPFVKEAVAANASAAKIKELAGKAGPMASMLGIPGAGDLENYVLTQVIDTTFGFVAKQEAALRANPSMLKDPTAEKVFTAGKK